jgi:hypothetical protein
LERANFISDARSNGSGSVDNDVFVVVVVAAVAASAF